MELKNSKARRKTAAVGAAVLILIASWASNNGPVSAHEGEHSGEVPRFFDVTHRASWIDSSVGTIEVSYGSTVREKADMTCASVAVDGVDMGGACSPAAEELLDFRSSSSIACESAAASRSDSAAKEPAEEVEAAVERFAAGDASFLPANCALVGPVRSVRVTVDAPLNALDDAGDRAVFAAMIADGRQVQVEVVQNSDDSLGNHQQPVPKSTYLYTPCNNGSKWWWERVYFVSDGDAHLMSYKIFGFPVHLNKNNYDMHYVDNGHSGGLYLGLHHASDDHLKNYQSAPSSYDYVPYHYWHTEMWVADGNNQYIDVQYKAQLWFDVSGPDPSCWQPWHPGVF